MSMAIIGSSLVALSCGILPYVAEDYYWSGLGRLEADIRDKLRQLRVSSKNLRRWLVVWSMFVVMAFLTMTVVFASFPFGLITAALLGALPWQILKIMAEKRRQQIEDQLADAMVALSSAIKAGLSLAQALDILAQQTPRPICQEFQQIIGEYQLGKPLERCLKEAKVRLRSENFALFAAAMEASRESGGRLNETVERIAHSVRELQRLERKILSETAQARTSAIYMALAPGFVLALYYFVLDPVNTERLFTTFAGQVMLCVAVTLNVSAFLWARKILNPEI
ncbi:MAG: type II secretion system F family protein [Planctomycetaceae bacterium]